MQFLQPSSLPLMVFAMVAALGLTAATAVLWDRRGGWLILRVGGPACSMVLFALALFILVNRSATLFETWAEVWGFLR